MDLKLSDIQTESVSNYNLGKLQTWLNYELSASVLFFMSYVFGFTLILALLAALVFIPLLVKVLWQVERYGWLGVLLLVIILPPIIAPLIFGNPTWSYVTGLTALGLFYFYCGFLRLILPSWLD